MSIISADIIERCVDVIKKSNNTMVITGAGMSTESGIPDFRSQSGLYKNAYRAEDILEQSFFYENPKEFYEFVEKYLYVKNVKPNVGHEILAKWEKKGYINAIATQNIDGLHQAAGNKNVIEMHGTMITATCQKCGKKYKLEDIINKDYDGNYYCSCSPKSRRSLIKPDIVLYGEAVPKMAEAFELVGSVDLLIILGTSLVVYPVASIPNYLKRGASMIIINYSQTPYENAANCINIHNGIGDTLQEIDRYII